MDKRGFILSLIAGLTAPKLVPANVATPPAKAWVEQFDVALIDRTQSGWVKDLPENTVLTGCSWGFEDIPRQCIIASGRCGNVAVLSTGWLDADDISFGAVTGNTITDIVLGVRFSDGTSKLVGVINWFPGMPCTPNGGSITVEWPQNGIVRLD